MEMGVKLVLLVSAAGSGLTRFRLSVSGKPIKVGVHFWGRELLDWGSTTERDCRKPHTCIPNGHIMRGDYPAPRPYDTRQAPAHETQKICF